PPAGRPAASSRGQGHPSPRRGRPRGPGPAPRADGPAPAPPRRSSRQASTPERQAGPPPSGKPPAGPQAGAQCAEPSSAPSPAPGRSETTTPGERPQPIPRPGASRRGQHRHGIEHVFTLARAGTVHPVALLLLFLLGAASPDVVCLEPTVCTQVTRLGH